MAGDNSLKERHKSSQSLFCSLSLSLIITAKPIFLKYYKELFSSATLKTAKIVASNTISSSFGAYPFLLELAPEMHPSVCISLQLAELTAKQ